jgi:hypothetical protein
VNRTPPVVPPLEVGEQRAKVPVDDPIVVPPLELVLGPVNGVSGLEQAAARAMTIEAAVPERGTGQVYASLHPDA